MEYESKRYSKDLIFSLLDHVTEMVFGVEKIIGIYRNPETENLCGINLKLVNDRLQEHELNLQSSIQDRLIKINQDCKNYKWLDKEQLPFDYNSQGKSQLNIFDEFNNLVLLIKLPEETGCEIVLLYFKDDINAFGVQHQKSPLSADNKSVISNLIYGSVHSYCKLFLNEKRKFHQFTQKTSRILKQQRSGNKDYIRKTQLEELIESWANDYLEDRCSSDGVNYVYSSEAYEKIKNYSGEFKYLKKSIKEAFDYTNLIVTYVTKVIESEFIEFDTCVNKQDSDNSLQDTTKLSVSLQRVYDFLERLENAGLKVDRLGQNITGNNIGMAMEGKAITAAAISDYISKNRERINLLFDKYPDKWSFIRNNFKSIINVMVQNNRKVSNWF